MEESFLSPSKIALTLVKLALRKIMIDKYKILNLREELTWAPNSQFRSKLLYDWVKNSRISLAEFRQLVKYVLP